MTCVIDCMHEFEATSLCFGSHSVRPLINLFYGTLDSDALDNVSLIRRICYVMQMLKEDSSKCTFSFHEGYTCTAGSSEALVLPDKEDVV